MHALKFAPLLAALLASSAFAKYDKAACADSAIAAAVNKMWENDSTTEGNLVINTACDCVEDAVAKSGDLGACKEHLPGYLSLSPEDFYSACVCMKSQLTIQSRCTPKKPNPNPAPAPEPTEVSEAPAPTSDAPAPSEAPEQPEEAEEVEEEESEDAEQTTTILETALVTVTMTRGPEPTPV